MAHMCSSVDNIFSIGIDINFADRRSLCNLSPEPSTELSLESKLERIFSNAF